MRAERAGENYIAARANVSSGEAMIVRQKVFLIAVERPTQQRAADKAHRVAAKTEEKKGHGDRRQFAGCPRVYVEFAGGLLRGFGGGLVHELCGQRHDQLSKRLPARIEQPQAEFCSRRHGMPRFTTRISSAMPLHGATEIQIETGPIEARQGAEKTAKGRYFKDRARRRA